MSSLSFLGELSPSIHPVEVPSSRVFILFPISSKCKWPSRRFFGGGFECFERMKTFSINFFPSLYTFSSLLVLKIGNFLFGRNWLEFFCELFSSLVLRINFVELISAIQMRFCGWRSEWMRFLFGSPFISPANVLRIEKKRKTLQFLLVLMWL